MVVYINFNGLGLRFPTICLSKILLYISIPMYSVDVINIIILNVVRAHRISKYSSHILTTATTALILTTATAAAPMAKTTTIIVYVPQIPHITTMRRHNII